MKNFFFTLLINILLAAPLTACSNPHTPDIENAQQTLVNFFDLLNKGQYAEADKLYAGDYDALASMNPSLDPADHAALWKHACEINGFQCLTIRSTVLLDTHTASFSFQVEFNLPDGSLFVRGPCCGASETEMPSQSSFVYTITISNGRYKVVTLPVYLP